MEQATHATGGGVARRATAGGAIHPSDGGGTDSGGALAHTGEAAASGRGTIAGKNADLATSGGGGETPRRASSRQTPRQKADDTGESV